MRYDLRLGKKGRIKQGLVFGITLMYRDIYRIEGDRSCFHIEVLFNTGGGRILRLLQILGNCKKNCSANVKMSCFVK